MEINKHSTIWHAFGYHNAFNDSNKEGKGHIILGNIIKGVGYIPFGGAFIAIPSMIYAIHMIKQIDKSEENAQTIHEGKKYYKAIIFREATQAVPGSCLIYIPLDIIFSALRKADVVAE